jgi:hypothetical protein
MTSDSIVIAYFKKKCYWLYTGIIPAEAGSVSRTPTGSASCPTGEYSHGAKVILDEKPSTGFEFNQWVGDCTGTETWCEVLMTKNSTVHAFYVPEGTNFMVWLPAVIR